jgi:hypothetical protein
VPASRSSQDTAAIPHVVQGTARAYATISGGEPPTTEL